MDFGEQLNEVGKIISRSMNNEYFTQMPELEKTKAALKVILCNDDEYYRLTDVFMARYNPYDIQGEILYLERVIDIASKGISTKDIDHYLDLRKYVFI